MKRARFLIIFFVLLVAFEVPLLLGPVDTHVIRPITAGITSVSAATLRLIGEPVANHGTMITSSCFAVDIKNGCNGVEATLFLVAAILAFPAAWKARAAAAGLGIVLVQALNLIRVVSLYVIGCHRPRWFEMFHVGIWQTAIFAAAILFFTAWARRNAPAHVA